MDNFDWIDMTMKMNEVRLFSRTLVHRYTPALERTNQEYDLLSQLIKNEEGMTPIKLSKAMCLNKTIVSRLIDSLSKNGYVTKKPDMNDKRSS
ncbi:MAG TPA: MarR family transcriptional regulator, partial [Terrisporobacter glycolicus]|uniref:MarR family transcriptional regulator n=1 Tax=Terrisporobacter hibernicus TaxID=2813371 RepID=UPI000E9EF7F3